MIKLEKYVGIINFALVIFGVFLCLYTSGYINKWTANEYAHYSQLPSDFLAEIEYFKEKAREYNVDISKLEETKFYISPTSIRTGSYKGLCLFEENTILFPNKGLEKPVLWHELGHCVLGYDHTENKNHIMFHYSVDERKEIPEELIKEFFSFNVKINTDYPFYHYIFKGLFLFICLMVVLFVSLSFFKTIKNMMNKEINEK